MSDVKWERDPDPARPVTSATEAADSFKKKRDFRTVQRWIREGDLPGGKYPGKARWWVYTDTAKYAELAGGTDFTPRAASSASAAPAALVDLAAREREWATRESALLARDRDHQETIRQLLAANALEAERAEAAETAVEHLTAALAALRVLADKSGRLSTTYRDLLGGHYIPDDPADLT